MAFDAGTIASVVVGGLISGGATLAVARYTVNRQAKRDEQAERGHARAAARLLTAAFLDVEIVLKYSADHRKVDGQDHLPVIDVADPTYHVLPRLCTAEEWAAVEQAL